MNDAREPRPRTEDRGLENHDGSDCPSRRGANYGIASPLNFHDSFTALSPRRVATARTERCHQKTRSACSVLTSAEARDLADACLRALRSATRDAATGDRTGPNTAQLRARALLSHAPDDTHHFAALSLPCLIQIYNQSTASGKALAFWTDEATVGSPSSTRMPMCSANAHRCIGAAARCGRRALR